ncbi:hypothetical protein NNA36_07080 [Shimia sp. CNT1-13L.2]|uniref:DUF7674 family protein n=1 Tax=Shimia sp. CNT1-13L.2 TaxID=2959663 RepID=UPI0020CF1775|nr:hypothetical protein [Shimia sp. CNT1-13L.2]MCP9481724.1 hypothetical protein [Shimia sp. CNT1-13L.2]
MINRDQMFEPILVAYPNFSSKWQEFVDEWAGDPEGLPNYLLISDLVRECSGLLSSGRTKELGQIFEVVETWLIEGEPYVKEAATVGFIEDLQNENLHVGTEPKDFVQYLKPESAFWWRKVEDFWQRGTLLVDDRH